MPDEIAPAAKVATDNVLMERVLTRRTSDALNHDALRRLLVQEIVERTDGASDGQMVALFGPWGSGKSSLVETVRADIQDANLRIAWVLFDAWAYQGAGGLLAPLLTQLAKTRSSSPVAESLKRVLLASALFSADVVLKLWGVDGATGKATENIKRAEEALKQWTDPRSAIREEVEAEVGRVAKHLNAELVVVVVDNLDRCAPDAALGLLESLFVAGDVPQLLVICVADQHVLMEFITKKYGIPSFDGARYLEKVFPDYFRIPDPWVYWHDTRPDSLAEARNAGDTVASLLLSLIQAAGHPRLKEHQDLLWYAFSQVSALRNPRRMKRILRRLGRLPRTNLQGDFEAIFLLVILSDLWPTIERYRCAVTPEGWKKFLTAAAKGTPVKGAPSFDFEFSDFVLQMTRSDETSDYHERTLLDHEQLEYAVDAVRGIGL